MMTSHSISRRSVLSGASALMARAALPAWSFRAAAAIGLRAGTPLAIALSQFIAKDANADAVSVPFRIYNPHTEEKSAMDLFIGGEWNPRSLQECNWLCRDWREKQAVVMDRRLYAALYVLQRSFNSDAYVSLTSGYRTEKTNEMLRRLGYRAAPESFHLKGRATDLSIPGASVPKIAEVAQLLALGGVGQYSKEHGDFVHIDSGPVGRIWYW
jgi:uncharacterized protein YcbK (DUF882 family)